MEKHKQYIFFYLLFALIFSLSVFLLIFLSAKYFSRNEEADSDIYGSDCSQAYPTVIIDAGHGGEDGGAIGKNGVYEKDLNLIIANELQDMLRASGIEVVMTREDDTMLYDRNVDFKGRKKLLDLAARLKTSESYENAVFISIHMNSFPQEKYNGIQVYYSVNDTRSKYLAEKIQSTVCNTIQKKNSRSVKAAGSNIYLLDRIKSPAVLIECGFISNYEECELLCTEEYRQKLTFSIFCGIMSYISEDAT